MAYEIGVADNYKDLLLRLKDFLSNPAREITSGSGILELDTMPTGEFWIIKEWSTDWDGSGGYQLIVEGPGSSGADEIFVGIQTYFDAGDDYFNWRLQGYTGYSSGQTFNNHPGAMTDAPDYNPKVLLWNSTIPYWFVATGRRFIVVAKVSTVYECMYGGFILPYGLPNQIPYPLAIGGTCRAFNADEKRWSNTQVEHRAFVDPYASSTYVYSTLRLLHSGWQHCGNWYNESTPASGVINVWPFYHSNYFSGANNLNAMNGKWYLLEPNIDGSYPLFPLVLHTSTPENNVHGELQGCYALPGHSLAAEDEITIGGDTYIAFPNIWRTNTWQYWALKKE